ncbi:dnaJ homolog subfamily C member 4 isoform X2 [Spea bombifrons]|uniref:dnaJ homolog subfamily C member 4 isoform X2 n=1 Tax=Spea bombifrons TaxID=233779 RepID=UPI002349FD6F|nr:dnaJ homolog subfamily C member 4 isoform X2 [Spea bombifrons]
MQGPTHDSKDYYDVLGVGRKATVTEIKKAFFIQSKKLHPDSDPSNPLLHSQFVHLNEAYKVLSKDSSRRQYDQLLEAIRREQWVTGTKSSFYRENEQPSRYASENNAQYWSQFAAKSAPVQQRKNRNRRLVWYCILLMTGSMIVHYVGFSILQKIHKELVEEQQQHLLKIYNETKMAARANGIRKQQEILLQKHAEFIEKYRGRNRTDGSK